MTGSSTPRRMPCETADDDRDRDTAQPPGTRRTQRRRARSDVTPPPMPIGPGHADAGRPRRRPGRPRSRPRCHRRGPPASSASAQRDDADPQATAPAGARYEQPRPAPTPQPRPAPAPAPSQHFAEPAEGARCAGVRPAHADVGGDDRQSPRHRRPVARRRAVRGQDAVAARLAALDLPPDPHQPRASRPTSSTRWICTRGSAAMPGTPTRSACSGSRAASARPRSRWRSARR